MRRVSVGLRLNALSVRRFALIYATGTGPARGNARQHFTAPICARQCTPTLLRRQNARGNAHRPSCYADLRAAMRAGAVCAEMRCAIARRSLSGAEMRAPKRPALQLSLSFKTRLENFAASSNWVARLFCSVRMLPRSHWVPAKTL
eukprot:Gb_12015 [translate_table: standard]